MSNVSLFRGAAARRTTIEVATVRSADLLDATVAACALMAHADGEVAVAERRRILATLRDNRAMASFSREDIVERVAQHEANFRFDPELAQQIAREALAGIVGQGPAVRAVVAACREILTADGIAHPSEYRVLAEIRTLLGDVATDRT